MMTSSTGERSWVSLPSCCSSRCLNAGVSSSLSCMYIATPMSRTPTRNGILQPQAKNCASAVSGSVLRRQQDRAAPLASDGEALAEAEHKEQYRRPDPNRCEARQEAHEHRRRAHENEGDDQGGLAAKLIPEVAEEHASYRAGHESYRGRAERG